VATQIVQAPTSADHAATEPLSPAAAGAVRRLELALFHSVPVSVVRAVTQYETAATHARELAAAAAAGTLSDLDASDLDADSLAAAEDLMAAARTTLAAAGRLDLIEDGIVVPDGGQS
jgi:hypothetical protein